MSAVSDWHAFNDDYVGKTLAWTRALLEALNEDTSLPPDELAEVPSVVAARESLEDACQSEYEPALHTAARLFDMGAFESSVLALCLAAELDSRQASLCAALQGNRTLRRPTFGLASALFEDASWDVTLSAAPLRYWGLLSLAHGENQPLMEAELHLDERTLAFVNGINVIDSRLANLLAAMSVPAAGTLLPASHDAQVEEILSVLQSSPRIPPVICMAGDSHASKEAVAAETAGRAGLSIYAMNASNLPVDGGSLERLSRLWRRESRLLPLAMYIRHDEHAGRSQLNQFLSVTPGVFFVDGAIGAPGSVTQYNVDIEKPTRSEQKSIWQLQLGDTHARFCGEIAEQFSLDVPTIVRLARRRPYDPGEDSDRLQLWDTCRQSARRDLDDLAERIDARARWDDLVVPTETRELLRAVVDQVRYRNTVYDAWGYRRKLNRGLGVSALFSGESGTGKTMAAEVVAQDLNLDLYRIDLSAIVSKYVGETAKNLRQIFAAAEHCGAILFFDEADAIFGKRSEVKDSHDRYANVDIAYLLQRMEAYRGLAILASNFRKALDDAFVRRIRFIVKFERPSHDARVAIWKRVFPEQLPLSPEFDPTRLAGLQLTGGSIHNIAMQASFMAAAEDRSLDMATILSAARIEFDKLQRPAKDTMFDWPSPVSVNGSGAL